MKTLHYKILGFISLALGTLGAFLPLLPTTCFVLLSAWCFAKSSPRWHQYLLNNRLFGEIIQKWEQQRCMSSKIKAIAIGSMFVSGLISFLLLDNTVVKMILVFSIGMGIYSVYAIKLCRLNSR